ncbi:hypothetical protein VNO78_33646 [Psophocarpus tetragonolobus]|uniref:histone acetyltransferase n=1 Tax=Psophocarpus tetragonolobus TaxID=3891 RepID=A0AAN9RQV2_PSOTE
MHGTGSNLWNAGKQIPGNSSSFVLNLPLHGGFDLSHQHIRNRESFFSDWRTDPGVSYHRYLITNEISAIFSTRIRYEQEQASVIAKFLENRLFTDAASQEEYMNRETLIQRLETQLNKLHAMKCNQQVNSSITSTSKMVPSSGLFHARPNGSVLQPAFQNVAGPFINESDNCALAVDNRYGFPKGGPSHSSIVHQPVFSPDNSSSITTCTDLDVLPNFSVSVGRSNLEASTKPIASNFPQQQANNNWEMVLTKYGDCYRTMHKNDSMDFMTTTEKSLQSKSPNFLTPQNVPREQSKVSYTFPGTSSLGDLRQHQHQNRDFQQNNEHFLQPNVLHGKTQMVQPNSYFVNQGEHCRQMMGKKALKKPQLSTRSLNGNQQFTSESSADHFGLVGYVNMNSCHSSKVTVEQRILLEYFYHKNFNIVSRDDVMKYLHSTACGKGTCTCECYSKLLLHFEGCKNDDCHTCCSLKLRAKDILERHLEFPISVIMDSVPRKRKASFVNAEAVLPPLKRRNMESASGVSLTSNATSDQLTHKMVQSSSSETSSKLQQQPGSSPSINSEATDCNAEKLNNFGDLTSNTEETESRCQDENSSTNIEEAIVMSNSDKNNFGEESIPQDIEDMQCRIVVNKERVNATEKVIEPKADQEKERKSENPTVHTHSICEESIPAEVEDINGRTGFNKEGLNATEEVIEPKADQEKECKSPNATVNTVSLTDFFTSNQIKEHITSLRKQFHQSTMIEGSGIDLSKCQLCGMGTLSYAPVPIYCFCCGIRIKRNAGYYYRKEEDDTQHYFCSVCYRTSRGGNITFNGISVSKTSLHKRTNNSELEESWVQCNKCKSWQHQVCALYNEKKDVNCSAEYTCPICRLKEIGNGMHVPLPKTAMFGAKDLPRTMLSDHIEKRLFSRLMQVSGDWAKFEGNNNLDEVSLAESLSVRVVLSVDKKMKVKKQFMDIFVEENYPDEFPYTSKVILLFQQIEGVDVCLFSMYVQEFGSECDYPNHRSVYISYLDSVKYFRPENVYLRSEREGMNGEALRTFVYHEILIGYLDYCKRRGFATCYIWACPPIKGEDYILYCHPDTQKTPKKDKLRHWYHSMLRKAAAEDIVVGLTNIYDHFFVPTGNCYYKVTAARLPFFDGDFWSGTAMDKARLIEKECGGDYEMMLEKAVPKRALKNMGHLNPSKETAKDILVMQKLGQTILPFKEDFIMVQFQYVCIHCHEVIESGKRWFCPECNNFQECERCHTRSSHTSDKGEKHILRQVPMNGVLRETKDNDITLDNGLFYTRHSFLSFCQRNRFQFDSLRRAKYSSMMILHFVKNPTLLTDGAKCRVCSKHIFQQYWKCENCPEFIVCSACYNQRGATCHAHILSEAFSTAKSPPTNQDLSALLQGLAEVIEHATQCHSTVPQPCTYRNCFLIKKLFHHATRCPIKAAGGCKHCQKVWMGLQDIKKRAEWLAAQSDLRRRASLMGQSYNQEPSHLNPPSKYIEKHQLQ